MDLLKECINEFITENQSYKDFKKNLEMELFGMSFEDFYKSGNGLFVDPKSYALMKEYFKRLENFKKTE